MYILSTKTMKKEHVRTKTSLLKHLDFVFRMVCTSVSYVLVVQHRVQAIGGMVRNTLDLLS